jgi:hypothetical protein
MQGTQKTNPPKSQWTNKEVGNLTKQNFSKEEVQMAKNTWKNAHNSWP